MFLVSYYLAKYVALGIALMPMYLITHVVAGVALRRYIPDLYTSLLLVFPCGFFLLVYLGGITRFSILFNGIGLLAAVTGHAIIVVYGLKRRRKLGSGP